MVGYRLVGAIGGRDGAVLLSVDVGDMGGSLVGGRTTVSSLLAVPDEVLEVLYGRHDQRRYAKGLSDFVSRG